MSKRANYITLVLLVVVYIGTMAYVGVREQGEANAQRGPIVEAVQKGANEAPVQSPVVLLEAQSALERLRGDGAILVVAPHLEGEYYFMSEHEMVWFVPAPAGARGAWHSFACYRLYEWSAGGETDNFVQCGPIQSEDRYDGQAEFYVTVPEFRTLFERGAHALTGPPDT
jgi:hypothetical protein